MLTARAGGQSKPMPRFPRQTRAQFEPYIGVILGAKTGAICKHVGHILSKLNVENCTSAAVVALEKLRSDAQRCEKRSRTHWGALAGIIATELGELFSSGCEIFDALSS